MFAIRDYKIFYNGIKKIFWQILPRDCGHYFVWRHHPECQTAILLGVGNFEALLELFRKSRPQIFEQSPWWREAG